MSTRFVCLANSYKEGGRCLAGIVLDNNNNPIIENGRPKWIRPISNTPHGEIPNHLAESFDISDIIEINITNKKPEGYQSENVLFNEKSIRVVGTFDTSLLKVLCETNKYIFATRYPSLSEEVIKKLIHSLMLIKPDGFEVVEKIYEDRPNKPQQRLVFAYNGFQYDFSITDPVFLRNYQKNSDFLEDIDEVLLSLSVSVKFPATDRYYKLVAGIIPVKP